MTAGAAAITPRWVFLSCMAGAAVGLIPAEAWPDNTPADTPMGTTYCAVVSWMTGNFGIGLAIAAVTIIGVLVMLGKIGWGLAILAATGVATIFGAGTILVAMNVGALSSCPDNSAGGFGPPPPAPPPSPYIDLTGSGFFSPAQLSLTDSTLRGWTPIPTTTPIDGWLQAVLTGLPPGMTAVFGSGDSGGIDANGNPYSMVGFFNISGDGAYTWGVGPAFQLAQNGRPLPPGTPLPSSVSIQYRLYSSFSDYSTGCTISCALTSQYKYTISTTTGSANLASCTPGTCIAPTP
jgi:type IV secretory pathway VirB2 component (pilin)